MIRTLAALAVALAVGPDAFAQLIVRPPPAAPRPAGVIQPPTLSIPGQNTPPSTTSMQRLPRQNPPPDPPLDAPPPPPLARAEPVPGRPELRPVLVGLVRQRAAVRQQ